MSRPVRPIPPQPQDRDVVRDWLIFYDELPPGYGPPRPAASQVVASLILALLGYGLFRLIVG